MTNFSGPRTPENMMFPPTTGTNQLFRGYPYGVYPPMKRLVGLGPAVGQLVGIGEQRQNAFTPGVSVPRQLATIFAMRTDGSVTGFVGAQAPRPGTADVESVDTVSVTTGAQLRIATGAATTFKAWLRRQCGRHDPVGDLARDTFARAECPCWLHFRTVVGLQLHIRRAHRGAIPEVFDTLKRAAIEYLDETALTVSALGRRG